MSDVFACGQCDRLVLRYKEFAGYCVDHRVRELKQVWWFKVTTQLPYSFPFRGKVGMGARTMLALFLHLPPP